MHPQIKRNEEIDTLRGVAIVFVILSHLPLYNRALIPFSHYFDGAIGVDLFFVISGFVVTRSFLRIPAIGNWGFALMYFYRRRAYRILPSLLFTLFFCLCMSVFFDRPALFGSAESLLSEARAILLLHYNYHVASGASRFLGWNWSLTVEEHFYLLLPVALLLIPSTRVRFAFLLLLITSTFLVRAAAGLQGVDMEQMRYPTHLRLDGLAAGALLGIITNQWPSFSSSGILLKKLLGLALIVALPLALPVLGKKAFAVFGFSMTTFFSFLIVMLGAPAQGIFSNPKQLMLLLNMIGKRSYALYLVHLPALRLYEECIFRFSALSNPVTTLFLVNACGMAVGQLFFVLVSAEFVHHFIEKPFLRFGSQMPEAGRNRLRFAKS